MDNSEKKKTGRHAKMFDLLRKGDLREESENRATATAARYLDDATAHRFLTRGMSSLKPQAKQGAVENKATSKAVPFASRQTD